MKKGPIVIVGFGRSGTTWLSDIISKILGGIILFEPFHPKVFLESESYCYSSSFTNYKSLENHLNGCKEYSSKSAWLLRNHLSQSEEASSSFIKYIVENTEVIGFKTIRSNHSTSTLSNLLGGHMILIHRHPLAVLTSITHRPQFWNEYGWAWHSREFFNRVITKNKFSTTEIQSINNIQSSLKSIDETIVLMWALSFIISLKDVRHIGGHIVSYEELYLDPYSQIKKILKYLNKAGSKIHPSHIFTPSLTTLNTVHSLPEYKDLSKEKMDDMFWKNDLGKDCHRRFQKLLHSVLSLDQEALTRAVRCGYLDDQLY